MNNRGGRRHDQDDGPIRIPVGDGPDATYRPEMDAVVADMMERFAGLLVEA